MVINLLSPVLLILLTTITSALTLTAPSNAFVNENITATIISSNLEKGDYDVKIFVEDNGVTISQIYYSGWKSSFYYLLGVFPAENNFTIRAKTLAANASLCVRLRMKDEQNYEEYCQPIVISNISSKLDMEKTLSQEDLPALKLSKSSHRIIYTKEYRMQQFIILSTFMLIAAAIVFLLIIFFIKRIPNLVHPTAHFVRSTASCGVLLSVQDGIL